MEDYVKIVRLYSASGNYRELIDYLNGTMELLLKSGHILDSLLKSLDNHQHSLGVLYVLIAKCTNITNSTTVVASDDADNITILIRDFIVACDAAQVRLAVHTFRALCHLITTYLVERNDCLQGIEILIHAVEKIRGTDTHLSSVHAGLCKLGLCTNVFNSAIASLDLDTTSIASTEVFVNDLYIPKYEAMDLHDVKDSWLNSASEQVIQNHLNGLIIDDDNPGIIISLIDNTFYQFCQHQNQIGNPLLHLRQFLVNYSVDGYIDALKGFLEQFAGGSFRTQNIICLIPNTLAQYATLVSAIVSLVSSPDFQTLLDNLQNPVVGYIGTLTSNQISSITPLTLQFLPGQRNPLLPMHKF